MPLLLTRLQCLAGGACAAVVAGTAWSVLAEAVCIIWCACCPSDLETATCTHTQKDYEQREGGYNRTHRGASMAMDPPSAFSQPLERVHGERMSPALPKPLLSPPNRCPSNVGSPYRGAVVFCLVFPSPKSSATGHWWVAENSKTVPVTYHPHTTHSRIRGVVLRREIICCSTGSTTNKI